MNLHWLFDKLLNANYVHVENSGDYATERFGSTLYIYLESSDGSEDWKNNFDFPIKFNRQDGDIPFRCHRGFLKVWESIKPYLKDAIMDTGVDKIIVAGFSHGAALSVLCYEYVWFSREDIRDKIEGYAFGCPRVLWGINAKKIIHRWDNFTVIKNIDDLITHLPPFLFGYFHVGKLIEIGEKGKYNKIDAHRPENYLVELRKLQN